MCILYTHIVFWRRLLRLWTSRIIFRFNSGRVRLRDLLALPLVKLQRRWWRLGGLCCGIISWVQYSLGCWRCLLLWLFPAILRFISTALVDHGGRRFTGSSRFGAHGNNLTINIIIIYLPRKSMKKYSEIDEEIGQKGNNKVALIKVKVVYSC